MSVIVKGMALPKNCAECKMWSICECLNDFDDFESICYAVDDGDLVMADDCPLVEIPTPHGRLIDADAFKETIDYYIRESGWSDAHNEALGWVKEFIDNEQAVIEAEGSET